MRWFGGYVGTDVNAAHPRPVGARMLWAGLFPFWLVGHWPDHEVQTLRLDGRRIAVVGPCGAADISVLAAGCVSDTVTTYPGAYTVIEAGQAGLVVSTDLGGACPIYATGLGDATAWGSSARALAELTGASIDADWLAATLTDPAAPGCGSRSPFEKVTALRPGARVTLRPGHGPQASPLRLI